MSLVTPSIDSRLAGVAPGFRALSILVEAAPITHPEVAPAALAQACQQMLDDDVPWADAHLSDWDEVFKAFGAKPKRTPCSASALRKRVLKDGSLPSLDPVVDIYNAVSIRYAIPVGGENLAAYSGAPRLTLQTAASRLIPLRRESRWWNTRMLARLSGETTSASPAAAGTGDRGSVPVWTARHNLCGLFLKACRQCRLRH